MSRILALVVVVAVLFGGVIAVDAAYSNSDAPETDEPLQDDLADFNAVLGTAAQFVPFILVAAILLTGVAAFRGAG